MNETAPDAEELRIRSRLRTILDGGLAQPQPPADTVTAAAALHSAAQPSTPAATPRSTDDWWYDIYDEQPVTAAQPTAQPVARRQSWMRIPDWRTGQHADVGKKDDGPGEDEPDIDEEQLDDEEDDPEDGEDQDEEEPTGRAAKASAQPLSRKRRTAKLRSRKGSGGTAAARAGLDVAPRRSLLDAYDAIAPRIRWLNVHASAAAAGYLLGWVDYSTRTAAWIAGHGLMNLSTGFWCAVGIGCELLRRRARGLWLPVRWMAAVPIASIVVGTLLYGTGWNELDLPL